MTVDDRYVAKKERTTFATTCLLPILGMPWEWYGDSLLNVYIGDRNRPEYDENIFVLLQHQNGQGFTELDDALQNHPKYIIDYDPTPDTIMYVFSVPTDFKEDYMLFKQGGYSKFSPKLKFLILGHDRTSVNYQILTKNLNRRKWLEDLLDVEISRDAELLDPPNLEVEIYGY